MFRLLAVAVVVGLVCFVVGVFLGAWRKPESKSPAAIINPADTSNMPWQCPYCGLDTYLRGETRVHYKNGHIVCPDVVI